MAYTLNMDRVLAEALGRLKDLGLEPRLKNNQLTLTTKRGESRYDIEVKPSLALASLSTTLSHLRVHRHPLLFTTHLIPELIKNL
jgi:hypothetical protein